MVSDVVEIRFEIPNELHHKLKVKAASENSTLKKTVITILEEGVTHAKSKSQ